MDRKTLQTEILEKPYSHDKWIEVLRQKFGVRNILARPNQIVKDNQEWTENIESALELGNFETADERLIGVYEVKVNQSIWIEKNRVGLRNLLKQVYQDVDGALIVFVQDKKWRFSYVSEIRTYDGKKETEPKRYTYLFGKGETCRTAAERFEKFNGQKLYINDLYEAFSVEKLNKEFFKSYKEYFEKFSYHLAKNAHNRKIILGNDIELEKGWKDINAKPIRDYTKKLLGRLVFLQFLQKKGWMGVPVEQAEWKNGDKKFIQSLYNNSQDKEHFHSKTLRTLFFETLNFKRTKDIAPTELGENIKIPYLNGGLFDTDISYTNVIDFPEELFGGLLDFFERYNFTIDENDPYDSEVGIDPEMLGHIFENLLEENREKGAFYTPKEIVHYMCHESLIEYLHTHLPNDKKEDIENFVRINKVSDALTEQRKAIQINKLLKDVKICDPAIGSGAFPMGLLKEIFDCRRLLYPHLRTSESFSPAEIKKEIIQNNIYGVDIENGAVEIARLRFWLALVVDEEKPQALPNLDYKIMQGNSLIESFEGVDLSKAAIMDEINITIYQQNIFNEPEVNYEFSNEDRLNIKSLIVDYFREEEKSRKEIIHRTIDKIVMNHIDKALESYENQLLIEIANFDQKLKNNTENLKDHQKKIYLEKCKEIKEIEKRKLLLSKKTESRKKLIEYENSTIRPYFLWHLFFADVFDKGGFDIVIGNPPYIQLQKDYGLLADLYENQNFQTFTRSGDIYSLFIEKGIDILKYSGFLSFITSNKWMRAGYGENLRHFLSSNTIPMKLVDFGGFKVFESATVDTNIIVVKKSSQVNQSNITYACNISTDFKINMSIEEYFDKHKQLMPKHSKDSWVISSNIEQRIKEKIEAIGTPLKDWDIKIYRGVLTGFNEAFIIDGKKKDELIAADPKNAEIIKPILRGRDIKRYKAEFADLWLINSHNGIKEKNIPRIDINKFPVIKKHLEDIELSRIAGLFGDNAKKAKGLFDREDQGDTSYNLRNCAYIEEFGKEKIVYPNMTQAPCFSYSNTLTFSNDKSFILTAEKIGIKFLLALLNSKATDFMLRQLCSGLGLKGLEVRKIFIENLPIPKIDKKEQKPFIDLVNIILDKKEQGKDSGKEEKEIDLMVYKLYDLTEEEIKIVEGRK
ncbi:MAG: Eco57I restriction-modification methylase domain-containing protein [Candidatus Kapabacteria bacterium]|nr:Eco57I restriction-modification methylase domain-containing protein [Candidatus Kapabacteria bacterium]